MARFRFKFSGLRSVLGLTLVGLIIAAVRLMRCVCVYNVLPELKEPVDNVIKRCVNEPTPEEDKTWWRKPTHINVTERKFVASEENRVFILGVVAKNSTPSAKWDQYALYGQWYTNLSTLTGDSLRCCFKSHTGQIIELTTTDYNILDYDIQTDLMLRATLMLWHITCTRPGFDPRLVSITRYSKCNNENVRYLEPYYAMKQPDDHLVITTKFAYGKDIDPEYVVSFLETMKYLGVDKVITYVYPSLDPKVDNILQHYSYKGFLDYHTLEFADGERVDHRMPPLGYQYMSDEWLIKKDALERNIGSTYFGIFDMDEFLIPSRGRSYKKLLRDLRTSNPHASHFCFKNVHYLTDAVTPDDICAPNCTLFSRHVVTSPMRFNMIHKKYISIISRVSSQSVNNHFAQPLPGYRNVTCPNTEAYVRHYGCCLRKFTPAMCKDRRFWVTDVSMVEWASNTIDLRIREAKKVLGLI